MSAPPAARAPLIVGSLAHAANDAYAGFLPALLPVYYLHLGLDEAALAFLVAIFAISASLPGPLLGLLADRVGARTVAAFSVALSALLMSLLAMAPQPAYLFALTAAAGLGSAAIHPSGSLLVRRGRVTPELAVALFSAAGMLGYAAGPVLLGAARAQSGSLLPVVLAAPGLLAALAILALLPREKKPAPAKGAPAPRFEISLIAGRVGLLTLAAAFAFLPATAMLNGLPLLLVERHGLDPTEPMLGRTIGLYSMASAVGGVGVGLLAARLPRRPLLAAVLVGSVPVSVSVLFTVPGGIAFSVVLSLARMLGYAATPLMVVAAQDLAPRSGAAAAGMIFGLAAAMTGELYLGLGAVQAQLGTAAGLALAFLGPLVAAAIALPAMAREGPHQPSPDAIDSLDRLCRCACASGAWLLR